MGGTLTLSASLLQAPAKHVEAGVSGALNLELERLSSLAGLDRAHPGLLALQAGANQLSDLHGEAGCCRIPHLAWATAPALQADANQPPDKHGEASH